MSDTGLELIEQIRRKAPEYLDVLTAETEEEFARAFNAIMERAVAHLERNRRNFQRLNEEGLSGVLAGAISIPGLTVTQETHSNGHVDLTVEADHCRPARRMLGEAKIYRGPKYHLGGLDQLLRRYTTGREGRGFLIAYVRKKNIEALVEKLRKVMDDDRPLKQQGETKDHDLRWSFISVHAHDCGNALQVSHVGCNLYAES
jgi:hypothetical protein